MGRLEAVVLSQAQRAAVEGMNSLNTSSAPHSHEWSAR